RRLAIVLEREVAGTWRRVGCREQPRNEPVLRRRGLQEQHRVVQGRALKGDLREARESTAEECGVNGAKVFEERLGAPARQFVERHDRIVERKRIRLEVVWA